MHLNCMFPWRLSLTRFVPQWVLWGSVIRVARFRVCFLFPWHLCFSWVKSTEGLSIQDSHTMVVFFRMTLNTNLGEHFLCISPLSASATALHPLPGFSFLFWPLNDCYYTSKVDLLRPCVFSFGFCPWVLMSASLPFTQTEPVSLECTLSPAL